MKTLLQCVVVGLCVFCHSAVATEGVVAPGSVVLNTGPTDCGLALIGQEFCPEILPAPCATSCEVKILANPNDPFDTDTWVCWNSETYNWQTQATVPSNANTPVNKFSPAPAGGGKVLGPPANGPKKIICADFYECSCESNPWGGKSCVQGSTATGSSYLLCLVRTTTPCPAPDADPKPPVVGP